MLVALLHGLNLLAYVKSQRNFVIPVLLHSPFINLSLIIVGNWSLFMRINSSNAFTTELRNENRLLEKLSCCITQRLSHSILSRGKYLCSPFWLQAWFSILEWTLHQEKRMIIATCNLLYFPVPELREVRMDHLDRVLDFCHLYVVLHFCVIDFTQHCINLWVLEVHLQFFTLIWYLIFLLLQLLYRSQLLIFLLWVFLFFKFFSLYLANERLRS